ncbi:MAG TPA: efflux transporter outer membrane subunit [Bryobacteraceae bacterium]|nr:efflux transporter outer membrane subunit [Bryobacteraceae bacterium]
MKTSSLKTAIFSSIGCSIIFCSACTVGPKYQRPAVAQTPVAFKEMLASDQWKTATPSDELIKGNWWELFGDAELNKLEEQVNFNNQSVKQAEAQFRQARALVNLQRSGYYPNIGAGPSVTQTDRVTGYGSSFSLPISASWEPDLWGRVRLAVENATDNAQVSAADLENTRLSSQGLLATDYFQLAASYMQQDILTQTIADYTKNLELTTNRYNGGVASKTDVSLAQTQLAGARAQMTELNVARSQFQHAIAVLIGQAPAALEILPGKINGPPPPVPMALPSQLLERRPDIAASERLVAAANANVGVAETAYYPTLTLTASAGFISTNLQNLFKYASRTWSAGPGLSQTLFDFGRRGATLEGAQASYDGTVASYRQTVLAAFQEVEDDLSTLRYLAEEAAQQQEAVTAANQSLALENDRYKAGTDSYLNVITTEEIALSDQQQAITILQRRMVAAVDLVKAIGGGWDASVLPSKDAIRSVAMADKATTVNVAQPLAK